MADIRLYDGRRDAEAWGAVTTALAREDMTGLAALHGDFAAAAVSPDVHALLLCRDHMGIRSLFYTRTGNGLIAFSTLMMPLVRSGLASDAPNRDVIAKSFIGDFQTGGETTLSDISRVEPGHVLRISREGTRSRPFWRLTVPRKRLPGRSDPAAMAGELRKALQRAISRRLPAEGDVASHCSGGLDSSSLTVLAARELAPQGRKVLGCLVAAQHRDDVEVLDGSRHVAALAQRQEGVEIARIERVSFRSILDSELRCDMPWPGDWADSEWARSAEEAGRRGIPVILAGYGGEETCSWPGGGGLLGALRALDFRTVSRLAGEYAADRGKSRAYVAMSQIAQAILPGRLMRAVRGPLGLTPNSYDKLVSFITPKGRRLLMAPPKFWSDRGSRMRRLTNGRLSVGAEAEVAFCSRYGVAPAYPYLDLDLIAYSLSLPEGAFVRDGSQRWMVREAMQDLLPELIRTEEKRLPTDSSTPLIVAETRAEMLAEIERMKSTRAAEYVELDRLAQALKDLPDTDEVRAEVDRRVKEQRTSEPWPAGLANPYIFARFLARAELQAGETGGPS